MDFGLKRLEEPQVTEKQIEEVLRTHLSVESLQNQRSKHVDTLRHITSKKEPLQHKIAVIDQALAKMKAAGLASWTAKASVHDRGRDVLASLSTPEMCIHRRPSSMLDMSSAISKGSEQVAAKISPKRRDVASQTKFVRSIEYYAYAGSGE